MTFSCSETEHLWVEIKNPLQYEYTIRPNKDIDDNLILSVLESLQKKIKDYP